MVFEMKAFIFVNAFGKKKICRKDIPADRDEVYSQKERNMKHRIVEQ